jgi:hypothetical protein
MRRNFLSPYTPIIHSSKSGKLLTCLYKKCKISAKPEEMVRQQILHWLLVRKKFGREYLALEENHKYTTQRSGRPDIVIRDHRGKPQLMVEIKRPEVLLGDNVKTQAIRYAHKLRAREIWLTNGDKHRFFKRSKHRWVECDDSELLNEKLPPLKRSVPQPGNKSLTKKYFRDLARTTGEPIFSKKTHFECALGLQKMILLDEDEVRLPYSLNGFHILEDRGISEETVHTPGGNWNSTYRMFLVATEGIVETTGIGINVWSETEVILCVLLIRPGRKHHALQLPIVRFSRTTQRGGHIFYHSGRIGGRSLPAEKVMEAVNEAGRDDLMNPSEAVEGFPIKIGSIPAFRKICWKECRVFISNLLHYALIRSHLRETNPWLAK